MLGDINHFGPFASDVWGSVSEWAMVLVTIATAFLLLRTLRVQRLTLEDQLKVTKTQQNIQLIEVMRHREEIKPRFDLAIQKPPFHYQFDAEGVNVLTLRFSLNENPITSLKFEIKECDKGFSHQYGTAAPYPFGPMNSKYLFGMELRYHAKDLSLGALAALKLHIIFGLTFTDIKGNEYEQILVYVTHVEPYVFVNEPSLIKAVDIN
ncbi:MAG: hypothetical protein ACHQF4_09375 [Sphingobacteriales bacterium]